MSLVAVKHRSLYRVAVQQIPTSPHVVAGFLPTAGQAWQQLRGRVARIEETGLLGSRSIDQATLQFHALCEGLAALELRGLLPAGAEETNLARRDRRTHRRVRPRSAWSRTVFVLVDETQQESLTGPDAL